MSLPAAFARVAALEAMVQQAVAPPQQPVYRERAVASTSSTLAAPYLGSSSSLTSATTASPWINALQSALAPTATGDTAGTRALSIAQGEIGVAEEPPGSNDSPRIAEYRTATAGAYAGAPWCAYFVSWATAQAGSPIGDNGEGHGAVEGVADWASRTGRLLPPTEEPQPGDL